MMDKKQIVEKTKNYVKDKLSGEGSGHDYWHTLRVYNNSIDIAKTEEDVNIFIVELAALLHDIADHKFGYTDEDRTNIITRFLVESNVEQYVIDQVVYIVNNMSFKNVTNKHMMQSIEGKIVQDADRLDAIGAIGIARTFTYGGFRKREMYNPDLHNGKVEEEEEYNSQDTITHFYEKLLLLKDKMNTETAKKKAEIRHESMKEFLNMFFKEWNGEI